MGTSPNILSSGETLSERPRTRVSRAPWARTLYCLQMARVFMWVALFYVLVQQARSKCGAGSTNCKCLWTDPKTTKSYTLDISKLFTYPYPAVSRDGYYDYYYSPCKTIPCGVPTATQANVCQKSVKVPTIQFNCGLNPVWNVTNATYFVVKYTASYGSTIRSTNVTFIGNDTISNATATPVFEIPVGRYAFTVYMPISGGGGASGGGGDIQDVSGCVGLFLVGGIITTLAAFVLIGAIVMVKVARTQGGAKYYQKPWPWPYVYVRLHSDVM
eukprot:Em0002g179a